MCCCILSIPVLRVCTRIMPAPGSLILPCLQSVYTGLICRTSVKIAPVDSSITLRIGLGTIFWLACVLGMEDGDVASIVHFGFTLEAHRVGAWLRPKANFLKLRLESQQVWLNQGPFTLLIFFHHVGEVLRQQLRFLVTYCQRLNLLHDFKEHGRCKFQLAAESLHFGKKTAAIRREEVHGRHGPHCSETLSLHLCVLSVQFRMEKVAVPVAAVLCKTILQNVSEQNNPHTLIIHHSFSKSLNNFTSFSDKKLCSIILRRGTSNQGKKPSHINQAPTFCFAHSNICNTMQHFQTTSVCKLRRC